MTARGGPFQDSAAELANGPGRFAFQDVMAFAETSQVADIRGAAERVIEGVVAIAPVRGLPA
ncbi:hypothetical protein, partial [Microbacterium sp. C448]|uniref:hypothetical protein n=1 Tax=Microbacterium sp. C448 TaxID=1177594 RepID=UPI0005689C0F